MITTEDVIALIREHVQDAGSQKGAAIRLRISRPHLNDILHGRRSPGPKVLRALKLQREQAFRPISNAKD